MPTALDVLTAVKTIPQAISITFPPEYTIRIFKEDARRSVLEIHCRFAFAFT